MQLRTIVCDACGNRYTETKEGDGFPGWGQLSGIALNGSPNPHLCPSCLGSVADFVDALHRMN